MKHLPLLLSSLFVLCGQGLADDWTQFRGLRRDGVSRETGLLKTWPEGGPKRLWLSTNAGAGYAGPAIVGDKLFTLGQREDAQWLLCLDAKDGRELWATRVGDTYLNEYGDGPRSTPTVVGDRLFALTAGGRVVCARLADGGILWQAELLPLVEKMPYWGFAEGLLVEGGKVFASPGMKGNAVVALDAANGKEVWRSAEIAPEPHYPSLIAADLNGTRQLIQVTLTSIAGINARDGAVLWRAGFRGSTVVVATPVFRDPQVYVSCGYGAGGKAVRVGAGNVVTDVFENKVMKNHHGGVVLAGEHLYGYSDGAGWVCQDWHTGKEAWSSKDLGKGSVIAAAGRLYCFTEDKGIVVLADASPNGWKEHGRFELSPQAARRGQKGKLWTHPVISNGRLYLRDQELLSCFDIRSP